MITPQDLISYTYTLKRERKKENGQHVVQEKYVRSYKELLHLVKTRKFDKTQKKTPD